MSGAFDVTTGTPIAAARAAVVTLKGTGPNQATDVNTKSSTTTVTRVASNAASATQLAANANRVRVSVYNDPAGGAGSILYMRLDPSAATTLNFAATPVASGGYWEAPVDYTGEIRAIWSVANAAQAQWTEYNP